MDWGSKSLEFITKSFAALGVLVAAIGWPLLGQGFAFSFLCGTLWMAINFLVLAMVIRSTVSLNKARGLFIFAIVCAKIPAAYFLLYWLFRVDYLEPAALAAGLTTLPVVLVFCGLNPRLRAKREEGKQ